MKKYSVIILFCVIPCLQTTAQISPKSAKELIKYYDDNLSDLDDIEGIYNVEIEQGGANAFVTFPPESTNMTLYIYKTFGNDFKIWKVEELDNMTIKKVSGSFYNYNVFWKGSNVTVSKRISLNQSSGFNVKFSIPDAQLRYDLGRKYQPGFRVYYEYNYLKTYPTHEMIYNAKIAKQQKEQQQRQEQQAREDALKPKEWSGSGFALNNGYIATNYHVVEDAKTIKVLGVRGNFSTEYNATVMATDKFNDLALIKISDSCFSSFGTIPYKVKTSTSDVGEDIFVLGYPLTSTMGDEIKLTTGVISSKTGFQGDVSLYQISAPIQPGNSGGPLFDGKGNLVGIVNAKHTGAENVGYAVKASYLNNLVESAVSTNFLPTTNSVSSMPLTNKVKSLKNFVFMIKCSSSGSGSVSSYNSPSSFSSDDVVVNNPSCNSISSGRLEIRSVVISSNKTTINFHYTNTYDSDGWCSIDPQCYITANGYQYKMTEAIGIPKSPEKKTFSYKYQTLNFSLEFPPIPKSTTTINFTETVGSDWNITNIKLK